MTPVPVPPIPPRHAFVAAAQSSDPWTRRDAATHSACPLALLDQLARDPQVEVRQRVASHVRCSLRLLTFLAHDPHWTVRWAVASHPRCAPALLHTLAHDPDGRILWAAARHPRTQTRTLRVLAAHPQQRAMLRRVILFRRACPSVILRQLAADPTPAIRRAVATHPDTPPPLALTLSLQ